MAPAPADKGGRPASAGPLSRFVSSHTSTGEAGFHDAEDHPLWPILRDRVTLEKELVETMEVQHHGIAERAGAIQADLPTWTADADLATRDRDVHPHRPRAGTEKARDHGPSENTGPPSVESIMDTIVDSPVSSQVRA